MVMRTIREEMRSHKGSDLSVPQFRMLIFLNRNEDASLSDVAEHMGLTLPSVSKMMDSLVAREYVSRREDPEDRRRVTLSPTPIGRNCMQSAHDATETRLAERLAVLSTSDRIRITEAMQSLESIFEPGRKSKTASRS